MASYKEEYRGYVIRIVPAESHLIVVYKKVDETSEVPMDNIWESVSQMDFDQALSMAHQIIDEQPVSGRREDVV